MILIWFNPILEKFYSRYYKCYIENKYYVGYENSYGHVIVQIFIFAPDGKIYNVVDYRDYYLQTRNNQKKKNSLLNRIFDLINK